MASLIISIASLIFCAGCLVHNVLLYHQTTGKWF